jgi:hypothetical protein
MKTQIETQNGSLSEVVAQNVNLSGNIQERLKKFDRSITKKYYIDPRSGLLCINPNDLKPNGND